jgi:hypothetical protein
MTAIAGNFAGARYDPNTENRKLPHLLALDAPQHVYQVTEMRHFSCSG